MVTAIKTKKTSFISMLVLLASVVMPSSLISFMIEAKTHEVKILKRKFIPAKITVAPGDTIIWKNVEKRQYHNVWFKPQVKEEPGYFFPGETYTRKFEQVGIFNYECGPHPDMKGVVTVKAKK